jgi:hypothetical protein
MKLKDIINLGSSSHLLHFFLVLFMKRIFKNVIHQLLYFLKPIAKILIKNYKNWIFSFAKFLEKPIMFLGKLIIISSCTKFWFFFWVSWFSLNFVMGSFLCDFFFSHFTHFGFVTTFLNVIENWQVCVNIDQQDGFFLFEKMVFWIWEIWYFVKC